ncbi:AI-2E family transporter [Fictibacillus barbaricus]|uniref:PurR-regulated permease PerM n=1 Tax=Fictibacillus barbaricus TaxID=182136 RepID=A0ABU1U2C8_9BACL|nr:AI-2E family transporter [Fictibacillus barbaricus]MDR7073608.1 putative PurR-regulated permease PerM [Fictibacillus barbaricus]
MTKDKRLKWVYRLTFLVLLFLCLYLLMKLNPLYTPFLNAIKGVFLPFFLAALITYLLHPVVEYIHEKGMPRFVAILVIYFLFFGGLAYGIIKGFPYFIVQLKELLSNLPGLATDYKALLSKVDQGTSALPYGVHLKIEHYIDKMEMNAQNILTNAIFSIKKLFDYLLVIVVVPFLVFYFLNDFEKIKKAAWYITPRRFRMEGKHLVEDIDRSLGGYIRGQLFVGAILGAAAMIALWIVGMPYPILLGIVIAITDIIPYFGPILGAIPVILIALTISWKMVWITIGIMLVLQFIEGNILGPFIVGRNLHIHPVFIIFSLLLGGELAGVPGMILAVPVFAVIKVIIVHIREHRLRDPIDKPD